MRGPLDEVGRALRTLWVAGSGTPDPELAVELQLAEDQARRAGAVQLADGLASVSDALELGDAAAAFAAQLHVWVRWRALQRGLAAQQVRERLAAGPDASEGPANDGWSGTFLPLGAVVVPPRVQVHGRDEQGQWRTFMERSVQVDGYDPWTAPWISRLFQSELSMGRALSATWRVVDHPGVATARRWVGKPAFRTRPMLGRKKVEEAEVTRLSVGERVGVGRAEVVAQRGRDGWTVRSGGQRVRVGPCLLFNLDKLAVDEGAAVRRDAVVLAGSGERVVLQWGSPPCFPTLDPSACTWRLDDVRQHATGSWGAVLRVALSDVFPVDSAEALAAMDGFPLPEEGAEDQSFWRQWAAASVGRDVASPAPCLVAAVRGAAAGEPVEAERLLQALWSLQQAGALGPEGAVLAQVAAQRGVARDGDVLEALLQAQLARHAVVGDPSLRDEEALHKAYADRVEEEVRAAHRRLAHDGVLPELVELFWLGEVEGSVLRDRRAPRWPAERLDRALVAGLAGWREGGEMLREGGLIAWILAVKSGRLHCFISM